MRLARPIIFIARRGVLGDAEWQAWFTGLPQRLVADIAAHGVHLDQPGPMALATFVLSNIVSNVPAVMLLLPVATHPLDGPLLALVSTFAGNLFIVGSIANIIVVDAARRRGVVIDWRQASRDAASDFSSDSRAASGTRAETQASYFCR